MPDIMHPVTGAGMTVDEGDLETYLDSGWVDSTPYEFQDNSWAAVNPDAAQAQADAQEAEEAPKTAVAPKQSNTTAADPDAAGVKADAGPS